MFEEITNKKLIIVAEPNIPLKLDFYALFMLLGIVQAIFLSFFFLGKENRIKQFNVFQGWMLVCMAASLLEIFLMYTGYISDLLFLVDFSETCSLLIAPLFYLAIKSLLMGKCSKKEIGTHLLFPGIYLLLSLPYLFSPVNFKFNAWVLAYALPHPLRETGATWWENIMVFHLSWFHSKILLVGFCIYFLLALWLLRKALRDKNEKLFHPKTLALKTAIAIAFQFLLVLLIASAVKLLKPHDTGDQIIALGISLAIYFTSFMVIKNSSFFKQPPLTEDSKYKNSNLTEKDKDRIAQLLAQALEVDKLFASPTVSLATLAAATKNSPHVVSQVINERFGKGFFEWLAEYRIREAKAVLKQNPHYKIEEVADQVGYSSKSSFNTAFKKITGMTPSQYRNS